MTNIDYSEFTVSQLRTKIESFGVKFPNGLLKWELVEFLNAILKNKDKLHIKPEYKTAPELQCVSMYSRDGNWLNHLKEYGWATVPIPDFDSKRYVDSFFDWLEYCCDRFKRNDRATWKTKNIPINLHGIFKQYIGQLAFIWEIREKCLPIFQQIHQTNDLLCSFDGGCFLYNKPRVTSFSKLHLDQGRFQDVYCVQGAVNLLDNGPDDGGLVVLEGSHKVFRDYYERHPLEGFDWAPVDMNDEVFKKLPVVKVCAPAGHILLWDSKTVHCNTPPKNDSIRMVTYVSMQPRSLADDTTLERRIKLYENGRMTSHWCVGSWASINPLHPRSYGQVHVRPKEVEIAKLNTVQRRLVGYED